MTCTTVPLSHPLVRQIRCRSGTEGSIEIAQPSGRRRRLTSGATTETAFSLPRFASRPVPEVDGSVRAPDQVGVGQRAPPPLENVTPRHPDASDLGDSVDIAPFATTLAAEGLETVTLDVHGHPFAAVVI